VRPLCPRPLPSSMEAIAYCLHLSSSIGAIAYWLHSVLLRSKGFPPAPHTPLTRKITRHVVTRWYRYVLIASARCVSASERAHTPSLTTSMCADLVAVAGPPSCPCTTTACTERASTCGRQVRRNWRTASCLCWSLLDHRDDGPVKFDPPCCRGGFAGCVFAEMLGMMAVGTARSQRLPLFPGSAGT
jgi:hypothetical protein